MQMEAMSSSFKKDFSEPGQEVASFMAKCDQSTGKAKMNRVPINKNKEEIESLKLKAVEYQKSLETMEAMKVRRTLQTLKGR